MAERASFGELLRKHRRHAGLTQELLAQRADLSIDAVAGLERGRRSTPHIETVRRLSEALRLTTEQREEFLRAADPIERKSTGSREVRSNIPVALSSFIGRAPAAAALHQLLMGSEGRARLVTLVGTGGIGKTRLALEVGRSLAEAAAPERFPDGIWLADLSGLEDPGLVVGSVAAAIGLDGVTAGLTIEGLSQSLAARRLLLILDNCEHLVEACARLLDALLKGAPELTVLATSREALGVPGEVIWPVAPLSLGTPEDVLSSEAAQLFVARARAAQPDFCVASAHTRALGQLCRQLDGIPLAIELAAARVGALDLDTLVHALTDRLVVLTNVNRLAPPRHQTLGALVQWSYDLLSGEEQQLFLRLAIFGASWDIDAALAILSDDGLTRAKFLDVHSRLVNKSLIARIQNVEGKSRYVLLETLRDFALPLLRSTDQLASLRERHARYYLEWLRQTEVLLEGGHQAETLQRIEQEIDNIRAALDWCIAADHTEPGLRTAWCLAVLAWLRGYLPEVDTRLSRLLECPSTQSAAPEVQAAARVALGYVAFYRGQLERAHQLVRSGLDQFRALGLRDATARALVWFGLILDAKSESERARSCFVEALATFRESGDLFWRARAATNLGRCLARLDDADSAVPLLEEALAVRRQLGDERGVANTLHHLADALESCGELGHAEALAEDALGIARSVGDRFVSVRALIGLGRVAYARGKLEVAAAYLNEALSMAERDGFGHEVAEVAGLCALVARDRGCLAQATEQADTALRSARTHARHAEAARALFVLGSVAEVQQQTGRARVLLRQSLEEYRADGNRTGTALALAALALLLDRPAVAAAWLSAASTQCPPRTWSIESYELKRLLPEPLANTADRIDFDLAIEDALACTEPSH